MVDWVLNIKKYSYLNRMKLDLNNYKNITKNIYSPQNYALLRSMKVYNARPIYDFLVDD